MDDLTLDASAYAENEYPARVGDWLASGRPLSRVAQIKKLYRDRDWEGHQSQGFLADLVFYDLDGNKLGRVSDNAPFQIDGHTYRGPRSHEPCCSLEGWYRIATPTFPLKFGPIDFGDRAVFGYGVGTEVLGWGKYPRRQRKKAKLPDVAQVVKSNYDAELERRARCLAAEQMRDVARSLTDPAARAELIAKAEELEREAKEL